MKKVSVVRQALKRRGYLAQEQEKPRYCNARGPKGYECCLARGHATDWHFAVGTTDKVLECWNAALAVIKGETTA